MPASIPDSAMRRMRLVALALALLAIRCAAADTLVLPAPALERTGPVTATYRLDRPGTGTGTLAVEWTDSTGRVVERRRIGVALAGASAVTFPLDLRRAVARRNELRAYLSFAGTDDGGRPDRREGDAAIMFSARPAEQGWQNYQIILWQGQSPARYAGLRRLGITAGMVLGRRGTVDRAAVARQVAPLVETDLRYFVENIATDFYAPYHRWTPDRAVTWRFDEAKALYRQNPADPAGLHPHPEPVRPAMAGPGPGPAGRHRACPSTTVSATRPGSPISPPPGTSTWRRSPSPRCGSGCGSATGRSRR